MNKKGKLIVLSGFSGAGKGTLVKAMIQVWLQPVCFSNHKRS